MHVRLTGESKLAVGVMLNMISCVSLCVCPVQPVQGVTLLSAYDSWDRLQPACDPELDNRMMKDGRISINALFSSLPWCILYIYTKHISC